MKRSLGPLALLAGLLPVGVFVPPAGASSGVLDPSFGSQGAVTTAIGTSATAEAVAVAADGDLITVGVATTDGVRNFALTRHHRDGTLDRTFGTDGVVTAAAGLYPETQAVALQPDGTIVVAGKALGDPQHSTMFLARFHPDGTRDQGFGDAGVVTVETGTFGVNQVAGLALAPDGRLVVAADVGPGGVNNFGVLRFNADGTRDETFGTDGMVVTDMTTFAAAAPLGQCAAAIPGGLVVQPDGKVVVAGSLEFDGPPRSDTRVGLVRYDTDGSPDATFGTGGILISVVHSSTGAALARQNDGSLIVGGTAGDGGGGFGLARYHGDGTLDTTFGTNGTTRLATSNYSAPSGLFLGADGKLVIDGFAYLGPNLRGVAVARFDADGTPDPTFGTGGLTTTATGELFVPTGPNASHWTLACPFRCVAPVVSQPDGRLIVADGTYSENDERPTFRLLRYADSPTPDTPPSAGSPTTTITGPAATRTGTPAQDQPHADPATTTTAAAPPPMQENVATAPVVAPVATRGRPERPIGTAAASTTTPPTQAAPTPLTIQNPASPSPAHGETAAATVARRHGSVPIAVPAALLLATLAAIAGAGQRLARRRGRRPGA